MIESLEDRIAPAAVLTFFEADGDKVTVKTSKGTKADLSTAAGIAPGDTGITSLDLNFLDSSQIASEFAGTNITITAKGGSGPTKGKVNFVTINGFNGTGEPSIDFGKVTIKGNLVYIDAGDSDLETPAIKKLTVTNWTPGNGNSAATSSEIHGNIGSIKVTNNFDGYIISEDGAQNANYTSNDGTRIGSFQVGNQIASVDGDDVGHIQVNSIGKLKVNTFFGPLISGTDCGLIEAVTIDRISIKHMEINARIVLGS